MNSRFFDRLAALLACAFIAIGANANVFVSKGLTENTPIPGTQSVLGDVNGDGKVSIQDVTTLIDMLLEGTSTDVADVNGDGRVSIADVTTVIDLLLEVNSSGDPETPTALEAPSILILGNSFTLDSWSYVPFLLKDYGINIKLGIYYLAGNSLAETRNGYNYGTSYSSFSRGFYYIDTSTDTAWSQKIPKSVLTVNDVQYVCP
jgi:hypothetical protein